MTDRKPIFELDNVSVKMNRRCILAPFSLQISENEHTLVLGSNGAGKSTLLRLLTRELHPYGGLGTVSICGSSTLSQSKARKTIGVVSPDLESKLIHDPTVFELVVSGALGTLGILEFSDPCKEQIQNAEELLIHFGLEPLRNRNLSTLSSGERKRAWIARALVGNPTALVLDEPDAHLDSESLIQLQTDFQKAADRGVTLVCASHRISDLHHPFVRKIRMKDGIIIEDSGIPNSSFVNPAPPLELGASDEEYLNAMRHSPIHQIAELTPTDYCRKLSAETGNSVWLKREDLQPVRSFKLRGAYHRIAMMTEAERLRGIITASAGNHAQGVALSAQKLKIEAVIVVPRTTPEVKQEAIRSYGAELVLAGDTYDEAQIHASKLAKERDLVYVHPFDDPTVIAGQGTIMLEILDQTPPLDAIFVAVGGGGLIAGIAIATKLLSPKTLVIGVEPEDSDAMHKSLAAGRRITLEKVGLLADGVAVRTVGKETFRIAKKRVDEVIVVSNDAICGAIKEIFEDRRAILEPAGALAYAGLKAYSAREKWQGKNLAAIACGANVNFDRLRYIAERANVGERREAILACRIPEQKGSFLRFCETIGARPVTEFNYRMSNPKEASVFVGFAVKNGDERLDLVRKLEESGYKTFDLTADELATTHLRHMVGGISNSARNERLFHFDFPERPGALLEFLQKVGADWNISLFHYRNHGSDRGRVLVGIEIPPETESAFDQFRAKVGCESIEVTSNPGLNLFLGQI